MATATVSKKGWVVIPKAIRDRLGIKPGSRVSIDERDGVLVVVPVPDDPIEAAYGILRGLGGPSLVEETIREHREEVEREEW